MPASVTPTKLLTLEIPFTGHPEMEVPVKLYAFTPEGTFVAGAPIKGGTAQLPLPEEKAARILLFVAPPLPENTVPTVKDVERLTPYRPVFTYEPDKTVYKLLPIPEGLIRPWMPVPVRVRGRVVKPVDYYGTTRELPVAHARVTVYEVDPIVRIIPQLPDAEILRIRDELIGIVTKWPKDLPPIVQGPDPVAELKAMSPTKLRNVLVKQFKAMPEKIRQIVHWWPRVQMEEMATLETDHDGRFDVQFMHWPFSDHPDPRSNPLPDLYFRVSCLIDGDWQVVYAVKPEFWGTYWEYAGQEVILRVDDPRVVAWPHTPVMSGWEVGVIGIGNTPLNLINQNDGLVHAPNDKPRPFGGVLEPHVWFGEELARAGAYYRWSYRKQGTAAFHVVTAPVIRHYMVRMPNGDLKIKTESLGPVAVPGAGMLYRVQPLNPPEGRWAPEVEARLNTATAHWGTAVLENCDPAAAAGLWELKLEVFNHQGHRIPVPFKVMKTTQMTPADLVEPDPLVYPVELDANHDPVALTLTLFVDNQPCQPAIQPVDILHQVPNPCGLLEYTPGAQATVAFRAYHPNGHADFQFTLTRARQAVEVARGGDDDAVVAPAAVPGHPQSNPHTYIRQPGYVYTTQIPVTHLLGSCKIAAFAEDLHMWARATDGWYRQSGLDRSVTPVAFALAPRP